MERWRRGTKRSALTNVTVAHTPPGATKGDPVPGEALHALLAEGGEGSPSFLAERRPGSYSLPGRFLCGAA